MNAAEDLRLATLSAYVDGELSRDEAAVIARRAAADPAVAKQLAMLQSLRAEVAAIAPEVILPRLPTEPHSARAMRPRIAKLAAAAVLTAALIGSGWLIGKQSQVPHADPSTELARLMQHHDVWRGSPNKAQPAGMLATARIADLMAETGLQLVHEELLTLSENITVRHTGYLGSNGCQLSLFELPGGGPPSPTESMLSVSHGAGLLQATWQTETTRFIMLARDMDNVRFATIASSLREALETPPENDAELIAALAGARQRCLA